MCRIKPWESQDLPAHWYQRVMAFESARAEGKAAYDSFQAKRRDHYSGSDNES